MEDHQAMRSAVEAIRSREMTPAERKAVHTLATRACANYDRHYKLCAPLECPCYMLGQWWTGSDCKYFDRAVLPLDPILEAALLGAVTKQGKPCPVCGARYLPVTSQAYCSDACRKKGQREAARRRKRKQRRMTG